MARFYHGTSAPEAILAQGFDFDAKRRSDPGDFGWGIYLTDSAPRARAHGFVLEVAVDDSRYARLANPYFLRGLERLEPQTDVERLFYDLAFDAGEMVTVRGDLDERVAASKAVRDGFLRAGYQGIVAGPDRQGQVEVAVFDPSTIHDVSEWHVFGARGPTEPNAKPSDTRPLWHLTDDQSFRPSVTHRPPVRGGMDRATKPVLFATTDPTYWARIAGGSGEGGPWGAGRRWAAELELLPGHPPVDRENPLYPQTLLDPRLVRVVRVIPVEEAEAEVTGYHSTKGWVGAGYRHRELEENTSDLTALRKLVDDHDITLHLHASGDALWIDQLFVPMEHRGRGLGRRVVDGVMDLARRDNLQFVRLWAADEEGTGRSNEFWDAMGFEYTNEVDPDDDAEGAWYMHRRVV